MLRTTLLLGALTGIILWFGQFLGGSGGLVIAFVFAVLMNFGAYWFSDKVVLAMSGRSLTTVQHPSAPGRADRPPAGDGRAESLTQ